MKWLQWSQLDVEKGMGGVETHIRSLARELRGLGVDARISNRAEDLYSEQWDVIHTHGSNLVLLTEFMTRLKNRQAKRPLWAHTLHGLTHERMIACKEYFWPGGYKAIGRELTASLAADVLFAIHPAMNLFQALSKTSKKCVVCGNGWDPWSAGEDQNAPLSGSELASDVAALPEDFWLYIGRGDDAVKNTSILREAVEKISDFNLVAVPGAGFETSARVKRLGRKNPQEVRALLQQARGLVLTSLHEGLPLVILEALAEGVPVLTTNVGGLKTLPSELKGLLRMEDVNIRNFETLLRESELFKKEERESRALYNRQFLKTWKDVATIALEAVKSF